MDESLHEMGEVIAGLLGETVIDRQIAYGELAVTVAASAIASALRSLREEPALAFVCLIDICGVDYPSREQRFEVVYHLLSPTLNQRLRVKVAADETTPVPSVSDIFPVAVWFEREAYDLYGILFEGNPDLRRILTDYGFEGHPLRKDFPLTGFVEVRYDEARQQVVNQPVRLAQEHREFDFLSPWEGTDYVLPGDEKAGAKG